MAHGETEIFLKAGSPALRRARVALYGVARRGLGERDAEALLASARDAELYDVVLSALYGRRPELFGDLTAASPLELSSADLMCLYVLQNQADQLQGWRGSQTEREQITISRSALAAWLGTQALYPKPRVLVFPKTCALLSCHQEINNWGAIVGSEPIGDLIWLPRSVLSWSRRSDDPSRAHRLVALLIHEQIHVLGHDASEQRGWSPLSQAVEEGCAATLECLAMSSDENGRVDTALARGWLAWHGYQTYIRGVLAVLGSGRRPSGSLARATFDLLFANRTAQTRHCTVALLNDVSGSKRSYTQWLSIIGRADFGQPVVTARGTPDGLPVD